MFSHKTDPGTDFLKSQDYWTELRITGLAHRPSHSAAIIPDRGNSSWKKIWNVLFRGHFKWFKCQTFISQNSAYIGNQRTLSEAKEKPPDAWTYTRGRSNPTCTQVPSTSNSEIFPLAKLLCYHLFVSPSLCWVLNVTSVGHWVYKND